MSPFCGATNTPVSHILKPHECLRVRLRQIANIASMGCAKHILINTMLSS